MKKTMLKLLGLAALAGVAFGWSYTATATGTAYAADRRIAGGECRDWFSGTPTQRTGRFRNPNLGALGVYCGIPSDNGLRHDDIVALNLHGYNPGGMSSRACVQYYNGSGGTCGASIGWDPGNGYKSMTGSYLSTWTSNPYHFPYVHTDAPGFAMIYGMWMHD